MALLPFWKALNNLEVLNLSRNKIFADLTEAQENEQKELQKALEKAKAFPKLKSLSLSNVFLYDETLDYFLIPFLTGLGHCLEYLDIAHNYF